MAGRFSRCRGGVSCGLTCYKTSLIHYGGSLGHYRRGHSPRTFFGYRRGRNATRPGSP